MSVEISAGVVVGVIGAAYISASLILFRFPSLLHRKKVFKFPTQHISHRGGAGENLENTMGAFRHAVNLETDLLELDCQLTKDGKVVVLHEANLLRLTGVNVNSTELLYKDLPPLKPELWLHFDNAHIAKGEDRKIALLESVFREFPNVAINIDLKDGEEKLILEVDRLIRKYNRADLCIWGNRSERIAKRCYEINPDVPLLFSFQRVFAILGAFYVGLLPFIPLREGFLEIPYSSIYLEFVVFIRSISYIAFNQSIRLMPPSSSFYDKVIRFVCRAMDWIIFNRFFFAHLDRRGIRVLVWVLQKPEHFDFALKMGAHGIMTDFPTRLREYLISRGLRSATLQNCNPALPAAVPNNVIRRTRSP